ncbi:hypothetical protein GLOIN_2v1775126 [Rhizophagus irregularis DAOM 181602=DAOM 197198]|nr:hypothetical protein GLOIN_2v1775126 [Rhizophagus irregularis DAOM 181602=DAOM 197198]
METGILPSKDNESDEESNDGEDDVNAIINNDCFLLDDEIVETVPSADDLQNEEEIIPVISLTEALINVET